MSSDFENEYIDENFSDDEGKFTCWSELEGGCNIIHSSLSEASICFIVNKAQIFEVDEDNIFKHWNMYTPLDNMIVIIENETSSFELANKEIDYLVDLDILSY